MAIRIGTPSIQQRLKLQFCIPQRLLLRGHVTIIHINKTGDSTQFKQAMITNLGIGDIFDTRLGVSLDHHSIKYDGLTERSSWDLAYTDVVHVEVMLVCRAHLNLRWQEILMVRQVLDRIVERASCKYGRTIQLSQGALCWK